MVIGYYLENILAFLLTIILIGLRRGTSTTSVSRWTTVLTHTYESFFTCAAFLTFSLQVASIVVLSWVDYGSSATSMGSLTLEITWAISVISLFPLVYGVFFPDLFRSPSEQDVEKERVRNSFRFAIFVICWLPSIYTFITSSLHTFGESQIGNHAGAVISDEDWAILENMCWSGIQPLSTAETTAMTTLRMVNWIVLNLLVLGKLVYVGLQKHHDKSCAHQIGRQFRSSLLFILPVLTITQFWTFQRLRQLQFAMSNATGNNDMDGQWTFGQVVAVTAFTPVLVDAIFWSRMESQYAVV